MERILVVDDAQEFRFIVATALRKNGYDVSEAESGIAAIESLNISNPQLILLDVTMPEMDGITFLQELKEYTAFNNTPVILLTGLAIQESLARAADTRIVDCLVKSQFSLEELLDKVRITLDASTRGERKFKNVVFSN